MYTLKCFDKRLTELVKEGVLTEHNNSYKYSDKFIACVDKINNDIQNNLLAIPIFKDNDFHSFLCFVLTMGYIWFIPNKTKFSTKGVEEKVKTLIIVMELNK